MLQMSVTTVRLMKSASDRQKKMLHQLIQNHLFNSQHVLYSELLHSNSMEICRKNFPHFLALFVEKGLLIFCYFVFHKLHKEVCSSQMPSVSYVVNENTHVQCLFDTSDLLLVANCQS